MRIYLIRHTHVAIDATICYGNSELKLTDSYETEKSHLIEHLPKSFDRLYCSPLTQSYKLACSISNCSLDIDPRLSGLDYGDWELKKWINIPDNERCDWSQTPLDYRPTNGETLRECAQRVQSFLTDISGTNNHFIGIISNDTVIKVFIALAIGLPLLQAFNFREVH